MIPVIRFEQVRPGDILWTRREIPRWIGSASWYAGLFCMAGDMFLVTDVYPSMLRVIHSEGGIHFIQNRLNLRHLKIVSHGRKPTDQAAKRYNADRGYGSWPSYQGPYRLSKYTPPRKVVRSSPPPPPCKKRKAKVSTAFASHAKRQPVVKRQSTKTKPKTK